MLAVDALHVVLRGFGPSSSVTRTLHVTVKATGRNNVVFTVPIKFCSALVLRETLTFKIR